MTIISFLLIIATLPLSLLYTIKVVQEYERAVIFRLGRLLSGGARGPGVFFIIPCLDVYEKIDLRTATYEIPPQEVRFPSLSRPHPTLADPDEGQRDGVRERHHVLQGQGRHLSGVQRGRLRWVS